MNNKALHDAEIVEVEQLVEHIKPQLAGRAPLIQSAILARLLSIWLAGLPPAMRAEMLALHMEIVTDLVPYSVHELFGERGHPSGGDNE
jgi:hypothetical protein